MNFFFSLFLCYLLTVFFFQSYSKSFPKKRKQLKNKVNSCPVNVVHGDIFTDIEIVLATKTIHLRKSQQITR
jgi:hypothetical protein